MSIKRTILVTGGTGYIGSHASVQLIEAGFEVIILDNLCNSKLSVLERIHGITGYYPEFINGDIRNKKTLADLFSKYKIHGVLHFAGLKAVGESEKYPLKYYDNNVLGSINLLEAMCLAGINTIIFSSSAVVYGNTDDLQYTENMTLNPINTYGLNKKMVEDFLRDIYRSNNRWGIALLRYFNPIGAHSSGLIGEDPNQVPNNLLPLIAQVAVNQRNEVLVFGNDYNTPDGTGLRDYIHVEDLVRGHILALEKILSNPGLLTLNLGTGRAHSVLEVIQAFEKASSRKIPFKFTNRRDGDLAVYFANASLANKTLGWKPKHNLDRMCEDSWRWQSNNPLGFPG